MKYLINVLKGPVGSFSLNEGEFGYPLVVVHRQGLHRQQETDYDSDSNMNWDDILDNNSSSIVGYYFQHSPELNYRYVYTEAYCNYR